MDRRRRDENIGGPSGVAIVKKVFKKARKNAPSP